MNGIITSSFLNPNGQPTLIPPDPQHGAVYYSDTSEPMLWSWSVRIQAWTYSGGLQSVTYTSGTPPPPPVVTAEAVAYDPNGALPTLFWNIGLVAWE